MSQVFHVDVAKVDRNIAYVLQWVYMYVASVCSKCFGCFRRMLHVFYLGVAYVSHLCCKCFIRMLHIFSHIYMMQVFHLDVAYVLQWLHTCFPHVSNVRCKCFNCFRRMLQMFSSRCCKSRSVVAYVAVDAIYSSRLLQLLGPPARAWVWRGHERQAWETVQVQIETERARDTERHETWNWHGTRSGAGHHVNQECSAGIRTLAPSGRLDASLSLIVVMEHNSKFRLQDSSTISGLCVLLIS
jgi:hypothetical protein